MQLSYSRLWDGYATDAEAKKARDERYKREIKKGNRARRWTLRNQIKKYAGLGIEDGRSCHCYMLDVYEGVR